MKIRSAFVDRETSNKFLSIVQRFQREAKKQVLLFVMIKADLSIFSVVAMKVASEFVKACKKENIKHLDLNKYAQEIINDMIAWFTILSTEFKNAKQEYNLASINVTEKQALKTDTIQSEQKYIDKTDIENFYFGEEGQIEGYRYAKDLQQRVEDLANNEFKSKEGRSFFAQAELDLRHDIQLEKLDDIYEKLGMSNPIRSLDDKSTSAVDISKSFNEDGSINTDTLRWLSSHKDCSERCAKWQGKLVSLVLPAINDKLETGYKINGHKIYSFLAIEGQTDEYGYHNNIINGFNCRHHLLNYQDKALVPEKFTKKEIEASRKLNAKQRELEREIRHLKDNLELAIAENNTKKIAYYRKTIKIKVREYYEFCRTNNLVIERKRI